jgi:hypothetical protein
MMKKLLLLSALALAGCMGSGDHVADPGERVVYKTVYKAVRQPCPATEPTPPAKLVHPLPADLGALVDVLTAKLLEFTGRGKYVDQVHDFAGICTKPVPADEPVTP